MKISRKKLITLIKEEIEKENTTLDMFDDTDKILLVTDPKSTNAQFALGRKKNKIVLFYLDGDKDPLEVLPNDKNFIRGLIAIHSEIMEGSASEPKLLWKEFLKHLFPKAPLQNIMHRLKTLAKQFV